MFSNDQIADIQGFNKVYQNLLKQIDAAILEAGYTLTEKNVLFELSKTERCTANIMIQQLQIDRSYMSRIIAKFEKQGLIEKTQSKTDSRVRYVKLTEAGRREINRLNDIQNHQLGAIFNKLDEKDQKEVWQAVVMIRNKLSDANDRIIIRPFVQSDIEYVISRHKTLYYAERHLSGTFSEYVDEIVYSFVHQFDPRTDCLNILECNGVPAGSIAIAKADEETAQLRFFMLEPEMRQRGFGNQLMDMALQFCRDRGYKKVFLLTITAQIVARHVYETHGFYKVSSNDKSEWGDGVIEERWEREIGSYPLDSACGREYDGVDARKRMR
ncbi:bifunctional helix-turn-helix transcriptional regulator/GNAT family N-acetyltransferase [Brotaphodocola sp.]|uniref:bifunctional helix-turn-helix transcriptional regulator/GNAT family N-acetyltransferase n=1 Tax=Brotaphodocola sp. TaxID=3073577 RepID=UPI003D7DB787